MESIISQGLELISQGFKYRDIGMGVVEIYCTGCREAMTTFLSHETIPETVEFQRIHTPCLKEANCGGNPLDLPDSDRPPWPDGDDVGMHRHSKDGNRVCELAHPREFKK